MVQQNKTTGVKHSLGKRYSVGKGRKGNKRESEVEVLSKGMSGKGEHGAKKKI